MRRYFQLILVILAAGSAFPLVYLRQNFEVTIIEALGITSSQLLDCYSILGVVYLLTYLPSGWLADRVLPRHLFSVTLLGTSALGLWFSTFPDYQSVQIIFLGWGVTTGLTFWAAMLKCTNALGHDAEQGRFFGLLDGGRGLVEAILATLAVALFAWLLNAVESNTAASLRVVIYMYIGAMLLLVPLIFFALSDFDEQSSDSANAEPSIPLLSALKLLLTNKLLWLAALCILCGYQLFWATYSFSVYLQGSLGFSAVAVGIITVAKLWMRVFGAIFGGYMGDYYNCESVMGWLMLIGTITLLGVLLLTPITAVYLVIVVVLIIGFVTYAIRGVFWATLNHCQIPNSIKGLAIGLISLIAYSPDFYLPKLNGYLLSIYPQQQAYQIYFSIIAAGGLIGTFSSWQLYRATTN